MACALVRRLAHLLIGEIPVPYDPSAHHRRSARLPQYDYALCGAYFVTICARNREWLFGRMTDGTMQMNACGEIAEEEWQRSATIRAELLLDEFIVMPDHIHGIVIIESAPNQDEKRVLAARKGAYHAPLRTPRSLATFVGAYKASVTRRIAALRGTDAVSVWQRNYFEHVIRNDDDLNRTREYIQTNPARWASKRDSVGN